MYITATCRERTWLNSRHTIIGSGFSCRFPLEDQLMPGTLEFAIHTLVETRLDTSGFEQKYRNDEMGWASARYKIIL